MNISHLLALLLVASTLLGAGCRSSSSSTPSPTSPSSPFGTGVGTSQASRVPDDVPVYPGGQVIAVTGYGEQVAVAQSTPDMAPRVTEWIRNEYVRRGATFVSTSQEGMSTNVIFDSADRRYTIRVDAPPDGSSAYLTISRNSK